MYAREENARVAANAHLVDGLGLLAHGDHAADVRNEVPSDEAGRGAAAVTLVGILTVGSICPEIASVFLSNERRRK